eukprot:Gb_33758 [translate_table: standard]
MEATADVQMNESGNKNTVVFANSMRILYSCLVVVLSASTSLARSTRETAFEGYSEGPIKYNQHHHLGQSKTIPGAGRRVSATKLSLPICRLNTPQQTFGAILEIVLVLILCAFPLCTAATLAEMMVFSTHHGRCCMPIFISSCLRECENVVKATEQYHGLDQVKWPGSMDGYILLVDLGPN